MIYIDINTFYCEKAGGIKSYHQSKINWFKKNPHLQYIIIAPGAKRETVKIADNIKIEKVFGLQISKDPNGYRVLFNIWSIFKVLKQFSKENIPFILEAGEPWISAPLVILGKKIKVYSNNCYYFYHSDAIRTYLDPWSEKGLFQGLKKLTVKLFSLYYFKLLKSFNSVLVSSQDMKDYLEANNLKNISYAPFGVQEYFYNNYTPRKQIETQNIKLLYAGRLDNDKNIQLLLESYEEILEDKSFSLTVAGRGAYADEFAKISHPRLNYIGYIKDKDQLLKLYQDHDVFLATGPWETFGLSVIEAMALGLVVVGPDKGGVKELIVKLNNPLMFKAMNNKSFIEQVKRVKDIDLLQSSLDNRRVAEEFGSWSDAIARMIAMEKN